MIQKKRKVVDELIIKIKIMKIMKYKRKICFMDTQCKKQKTCKCIVHEEKYICDIYECNGNVNRDTFMVDTHFQ